MNSVQALPRIAPGTVAASGGLRSVEFATEWLPGHPDWVVASANIRWNWRRRKFIARGRLIHSEEAPDGDTFNEYEPRLPWERRVTFDPPAKEGAVVIHPDAPDCDITFAIVLRTTPSPTIRRHVKSIRFRWPSPSRRS